MIKYMPKTIKWPAKVIYFKFTVFALIVNYEIVLGTYSTRKDARGESKYVYDKELSLPEYLYS